MKASDVPDASEDHTGGGGAAIGGGGGALGGDGALGDGALGGGGSAGHGDVIVAALDELSEVVEEVVDDAQEINREIGRVRYRRVRGAGAREALFGSDNSPRLLRGLDRMASRMSAASGAVRRMVVRAMLGEGEKVTTIARSLGVSHQRISSLGRDPVRRR